MSKPDTTVIFSRTHENAALPRKANSTDACFDLSTPAPVTLAPRSTTIVDLGLALQLEAGWEAQVRGRSGLACRGIVVHPGTIDHLYRQPLKAIIHNISDSEHVFEAGQRIVQMKIERVWEVHLLEGEIAPTDRGGLGSTGV
ncbi:MAG: dUTP diphosphatase [Proteobacteria bacterium]|nr:dUTP diphosphatase [Pseudomonadota bacterium]